MVDRSAKLSNSRVLFIATLFWVSKMKEGYFEGSEVCMRSFLTPVLSLGLIVNWVTDRKNPCTRIFLIR